MRNGVNIEGSAGGGGEAKVGHVLSVLAPRAVETCQGQLAALSGALFWAVRYATVCIPRHITQGWAPQYNWGEGGREAPAVRLMTSCHPAPVVIDFFSPAPRTIGFRLSHY